MLYRTTGLTNFGTHNEIMKKRKFGNVGATKQISAVPV